MTKRETTRTGKIVLRDENGKLAGSVATTGAKGITAPGAAPTAPTERVIDQDRAFAFASEVRRQVGTMNLFAISGGRVTVVDEDTVRLPVAHGYHVEIHLDPDDTYTVRRLFIRGGKEAVKAEENDHYFDTVGDAAYRASCYINGRFGH